MGFGTMVNAQRKYLCAIRALDKKELVVHRLHWQNEIRPRVSIGLDRAEPRYTSKFLTALESARVSGPILPEVKNEYQEAVNALIAGKEDSLLGREIGKYLSELA